MGGGASPLRPSPGGLRHTDGNAAAFSQMQKITPIRARSVPRSANVTEKTRKTPPRAKTVQQVYPRVTDASPQQTYGSDAQFFGEQQHNQADQECLYSEEEVQQIEEVTKCAVAYADQLSALTEVVDALKLTGEEVKEPPPHRSTFAELLDKWKADRGHRDASCFNKEEVVNEFEFQLKEDVSLVNEYQFSESEYDNPE